MSILVCVKCSHQMKCTKTGCDSVLNGCVVSRSDEYTCPRCDFKARLCNDKTAPLFKLIEDKTRLEMPLNVEMC